jgi:uncharacterized lipoprotein YbaY
MKSCLSISFCFFVLGFCSTSQAQAPSTASGAYTLRGEIVYSGLDALPWHSRIHIYAEDLSRTPDKNTGPLKVAEITMETEGEQVPLKFALAVSRDKILDNHRYSVCADISIVNRLAFVCDRPVIFWGRSKPKKIMLTLRRLD